MIGNVGRHENSASASRSLAYDFEISEAADAATPLY